MKKRLSIVFDGKTLYSVEAIAKIVGYNIAYVRQLAREGKISTIKIGPRQYWLDKRVVLHQLQNGGKGSLSPEQFERAKTRKLLELAADL